MKTGTKWVILVTVGVLSFSIAAWASRREIEAQAHVNSLHAASDKAYRAGDIEGSTTLLWEETSAIYDSIPFVPPLMWGWAVFGVCARMAFCKLKFGAFDPLGRMLA